MQETINPIPSAMETFRALSPPEGLKFTPLFATPVKDSDARMKRLEDSVQALRNDFDTVVPTLVRMAAIEKDIKALVTQLQTLTDQNQPAAAPSENLPPLPIGGQPIPGEGGVKGATPAAPPSLVTPEAAPKGELPPEGAASPSSNAPPEVRPQEKPAPVDITPQAKPAAGNVSGFRVGDHSDKTRVVLDMTAKTDAAARLENNGKTLVIDLSQMNWLGKKSWDADRAQLVSGYHIAGGNLYVDLMYASQIRSREILSPGGDAKNYRLVIDLFSPEVHK